MNIESIHVLIQTAKEENAGTDGDVYLGICGREFVIDTDQKDFDKNSTKTYIIGDGANIKNSYENDPRHHWIRHTEDLEKYPIYIRFEAIEQKKELAVPRYDVNWLLEYVRVQVNPKAGAGGEWIFEALKNRAEKLWLGQLYGKFCHLKLIKKGEI